MSKPKHTRGPWEQYHGDPLVIVNKDGESLGEMSPGSPFIDGAEALANAQLVAVAPELLAELEELLPYVESVSDDECAAKDAARIRALIAKAKGGAS